MLDWTAVIIPAKFQHFSFYTSFLT